MANAPEKHSLWGGSSANIWTVCTGAVELWRRCPPTETTDVMAKGTRCHELAAMALQNMRIDATMLIGLEPGEQNAVDLYVEYVRRRMATTIDGVECNEPMVEKMVRINDDMFGSADCVLVWGDGPEPEAMEIIDYKHGEGYAVDATDNVQLAYYAVATCETLGIYPKRLKLTIVQPRIDSRDPVQSWTITDPKAFLEYWRNRFVFAYDASIETPSFLITGDHCRFCRAKAICPEQHKMATDLARIDFEDGQEAMTITSAQIAHVLDNKDRLVAFVKAVEDYATKLSLSGQQIPGWRLEEKHGHRKWKDEQAALAELQKTWERAQLTKTVALSPNQIEGLVKKLDKDRRKALLGTIAEMTERPMIGVHLVKDDGKRLEQAKELFN